MFGFVCVRSQVISMLNFVYARNQTVGLLPVYFCTRSQGISMLGFICARNEGVELLCLFCARSQII